MKISIITPVLNDTRISRALDSILSQKHDHRLELILVDGGSNRETLDIIDRYSDNISIFLEGPDRGIYDAMNKGLSQTSGDVVGILNADDCYCDDFVIRDVMSCLNGKVIDACYGDLAYRDQLGNIKRYWKAAKYRKWKLYYGWMPPHPTFFVRKDVYERFGLFDLKYPIAADYDFMIRLLFKHKINVKYLDRTLVWMSPGGNANRSLLNILKANGEVLRSCFSHNMYLAFMAPVIKPATKIFQFFPSDSQRKYITKENT